MVEWNSLITDKNQNKALHLLCYALLYSRTKPVEGIQAGIISLRNARQGTMTFAKKDSSRAKIKDPLITPEVLQTFEEQLHILIREICNPEVPFEKREI